MGAYENAYDATIQFIKKATVDFDTAARVHNLVNELPDSARDYVLGRTSFYSSDGVAKTLPDSGKIFSEFNGSYVQQQKKALEDTLERARKFYNASLSGEAGADFSRADLVNSVSQYKDKLREFDADVRRLLEEQRLGDQLAKATARGNRVMAGTAAGAAGAGGLLYALAKKFKKIR